MSKERSNRCMWALFVCYNLLYSTSLYGFWLGFQIFFIFFNKVGTDYEKCFLSLCKDREHAGSFLFCHQYAVMISILWKRDRNGKETLPKSGHKTNVDFWLGSLHPLASAMTELIPVSDKSSPALFICAEL